MENENKMIIEIEKPKCDIGQKIFVPWKERLTETEIWGYGVKVMAKKDGIFGVVSCYLISSLVFMRVGEETAFASEVRDGDFYVDKRKAKRASRFLRVSATEEDWKLAIGDRQVRDEGSPYSLENCEFPSCCANISEARDILIYCKNESGLIVHERDNLVRLVSGHGSREFDKEGSLGKILAQLEIHNF